MSELKYLDKMGTFTLDNPDLTSYMYFHWLMKQE